MTYLSINGHNFDDTGVCEICGRDFTDIDGEDCEPDLPNQPEPPAQQEGTK